MEMKMAQWMVEKMADSLVALTECTRAGQMVELKDMQKVGY